MKKLLTLLAGVVVIAGFCYYYFSTPKILERRLDSLLGTLSFGVVSLTDLDKEGDRFASHFAQEITFSGSGNEIISGQVQPSNLRALYLDKYRVAAKKATAKRTGAIAIKLQAANEAEMDTTIEIDITLRDNSAYPQSIPARLDWKKVKGEWVISGVQLKLPAGSGFDF